jgi:HEAT repeat protein
MSARPFAVLLAVLLVLPTLRGDDDPEFNGKKLSAWLTMLKEDTLPRKRKAAVIAVSQIAADQADRRQVVLPALAKTLRNESNAGVRAQIAVTFGQQDPDDAGYFLNELAEAVRIERESATRREMAIALGRLGKSARPAVVPLTDALKDSVPATRAAAADALGRIGPDGRPATASLIALVKDPDRAVRRAATFALGRIDPEDPAPVSAALSDLLTAERGKDAGLLIASAAGSSAVWATRRDDELVQEAVIALGLLGDRSPEVVQAVAGQLTDSCADVRRQAALALGKFGPAARAAEKTLATIFTGDADKLARIYALHTLCTSFGTDGRELVPLLTGRLKADREFEVRVAVADELGAMGPAATGAIPALREAQRDPQIKVRDAAAAAIKLIQKPADKPKP